MAPFAFAAILSHFYRLYAWKAREYCPYFGYARVPRSALGPDTPTGGGALRRYQALVKYARFPAQRARSMEMESRLSYGFSM